MQPSVSAASMAPRAGVQLRPWWSPTRTDTPRHEGCIDVAISLPHNRHQAEAFVHRVVKR
jgi:hypothetical protein